MAELATGNREDALDLVQEAMMGLVKSYSDRTQADWAPLFHRILQSRIRDFHRRSRVRNRFRVWLGGGGADGQTPADALQALPDVGQPDAPTRLHQRDAVQQVVVALGALPLRQQQAFMLRSWEGLDVAQTAYAMGCSQGSVKTHYSRALHRLREQLKEYGS